MSGQSSLPDAHPAPLYVEFALSFVIDSSGVHTPVPRQRLNALESTITRLARQWRKEVPIRPARELRMSGRTRTTWLSWIEVTDEYDPTTIARLGVYASDAVTDDTVPEGWVRLRLSPRAQ
jgi:hypothetical protein